MECTLVQSILKMSENQHTLACDQYDQKCATIARSNGQEWWLYIMSYKHSAMSTLCKHTHTHTLTLVCGLLLQRQKVLWKRESGGQSQPLLPSFMTRDTTWHSMFLFSWERFIVYIVHNVVISNPAFIKYLSYCSEKMKTKKKIDTLRSLSTTVSLIYKFHQWGHQLASYWESAHNFTHKGHQVIHAVSSDFSCCKSRAEGRQSTHHSSLRYSQCSQAHNNVQTLL